MNQQDSLSEEIAKQEKLNIYLSQLLKSLQEKLVRAKGSPKELPVENRADLEIAQMKNIEKRIEIYKHQLQKLKNLSTASVVEDLNKLRAQIISRERVREDASAQLKALQQSVSKLKIRKISKEKNLEIQQLYGERKHEVRLLNNRLKALENQQYSQNFKAPKRKSVGSAILLSKDKIMEQEDQKGDKKKGKIDRFAMYKNLIRFYTQQEAKLKADIEALSKEINHNRKIGENIQIYQQKVASLIQKK